MADTASSHACCVVVPIYTTDLKPEEWFALKNNRAKLAAYPFIAIAPEGLDLTPLTDEVEFQDTRRFPAICFESSDTYSRLLTQAEFWEAFQDYEYMLIAQLDAIIFKSNLDDWLAKDYDYVGAPWLSGLGGNGLLKPANLQPLLQCDNEDIESIYTELRHRGVLNEEDRLVLDYRSKLRTLNFAGLNGTSKKDVLKALKHAAAAYEEFIGVGNGGLSLRNIASARDVLDSRRIPPAISLTSAELEQTPMVAEELDKLIHLQSIAEAGNESLVQLFLINTCLPEDLFWGELAELFLPEFKVAKPEVALRFSFETNPGLCFRLNKEQLPFGCHAWDLPKNRPFWESNQPGIRDLTTI